MARNMALRAVESGISVGVEADDVGNEGEVVEGWVIVEVDRLGVSIGGRSNGTNGGLSAVFFEKSSTSPFVTRPSRPVGVTFVRSTLSSRANRRVAGVARTEAEPSWGSGRTG